MKPQLDAGLKIADILTYYPQTAPVFQSQGFGALLTEDGMRVLAPFLTLGTALRSRKIDENSFLRLLQEAVETGEMGDAPGLDSYDAQGELTLLAMMPCGLKMTFSKVVAAFLEEMKQKKLFDLRYAVEGNVNQELSYYSYIQTIEKAEELPDIIISADFNAFYGHWFQSKFVSTGDITGYGQCNPNPSFVDAGIMDPRGEYTILGINPLVMVVNLEELGDRQLPTCWADILKPEWEKSVILRGNSDFFCHAVLLPTYQRYGAEGLKKLAANVLRGLHPAQMVKQIDTGVPGAVYVMPEFFAHRVKKKERIKIVWPEDGALASPVTLQVKKSRSKELQPVLDYLTGPELAKALNVARFPVPHAEVEGEIQQKKLLWPGWDFFRENDLLQVNKDIDELFLPYVRQEVLN